VGEKGHRRNFTVEERESLSIRLKEEVRLRRKRVTGATRKTKKRYSKLKKGDTLLKPGEVSYGKKKRKSTTRVSKI